VNQKPRIILRDLLAGFSPEDLGAFVPFYPGVQILPLYGLNAQGAPLSKDGPSAAILRYAPGAQVPEHKHAGYEHIFVLEGSQRDAMGSYLKGSCVMNPPGTRHAVSSDDGCLVLAIWNQPVEVLHD
jgi:anti-sigma factor ChrR (cupin superfamily)